MLSGMASIWRLIYHSGYDTDRRKKEADMADYGDYTAYFNGEWIPYKDVRISPDDRGFMLADVVFDIGAHLQRRAVRARQAYRPAVPLAEIPAH